MSGFSNPILGGGGALVYPQIMSPNFVHGSTGWRLGKDGSLEAHDVIIPTGSGVQVVTIGPMPAVGALGDIWYDTASGLKAHVCTTAYTSGGTPADWTSFFVTGAAIGGNSINQGNLSGAITARSLGGITTTIAPSTSPPVSPKASDIWIVSDQGNQLEQYSGTAWTPISWNAANVISAATITAALIAANTITAGQIAANTITAAQIAANTITASQIAANTITAGQMAANTITAGQLAAGIVYAGIINGTTVNAATFIGSIFKGTEWIANADGQFYYAAAPGANSLRVSIIPGASAVQDPSGNWALPGVTLYAGSGPYSAYNYSANAINTCTATVMTGVANPWTVTTALTFDGATAVSMTLAGPLTVQSFFPWQSLGSPGITFATVNQARYRKTSFGETEIDVALTTTGAVAAGAYAFANVLPPAFQFAGNFTRSYAAGFNGTVTTATNNADLLVDGAGVAVNAGRVRLQIPALPIGTSITVTCVIPLA